jgi:hypothetical protein
MFSLPGDFSGRISRSLSSLWHFVEWSAWKVCRKYVQHVIVSRLEVIDTRQSDDQVETMHNSVKYPRMLGPDTRYQKKTGNT